MSYISGEEFVRLNSGKKFYKLTNEKEIHKVIFDSPDDETKRLTIQITYTDGLVVDIIPFDITRPGGLYFTDLENLPLWTCNKCWIREVTILPDAQVFVLSNRIKANKLFLGSRIPIEEFEPWSDRDYCVKAVKKNPLVLKFIKGSNQFLELCFDAVRRSPHALKYVQDEYLTPEIISMAINSKGETIKYVPIKLQTYEICLQAVKTCSNAILSIGDKYRTPELCLEAIKLNPSALKFIREQQTPELCLEAVSRDINVLQYVRPGIKIPGLDKFSENSIEKYVNKYSGYWDFLIKSNNNILDLILQDDPDFACDSNVYEFEMQDENNYYLMFYMFDMPNNLLCVNLDVNDLDTDNPNDNFKENVNNIKQFLEQFKNEFIGNPDANISALVLNHKIIINI